MAFENLQGPVYNLLELFKYISGVARGEHQSAEGGAPI
jgi:hypothetical protein